MNELAAWAHRHAIPETALRELRQILDAVPDLESAPSTLSEGAVQGRVRLAARHRGATLWRNNVGVASDEYGRPVRFGLANDSKQVNERIKSSDLIGITPVKIGAAHWGATLGVFTAIECKHGGWKWSGSTKERAQQRYIDLVRLFGGFAGFARGPEDLNAT